MDLKQQDQSPSVYEDDELKVFSHSMAELQWLLLVLVLLYFFIPTKPISDRDAVIISMVIYAGLVFIFRVLRFHSRHSLWGMAVETWLMVAFITVTMLYTGLTDSPLLNLYLLVIIASAITMSKIMAMLQVALIASCYLYVGYMTYSTEVFTPETFTNLMARFSPFVLVAYVTSILAADVLRARKKITKLSYTDELTDVLNMRGFRMLLEKEASSSKRYNRPYTILMIDADGLKDINDQYGHSTGSMLIKNVANIIKECLRTSDIVARFGGDEFVVLLTNTADENSLVVSERIRAGVRNMSFFVKGDQISATVSIGSASFPQCSDTADEVLEKADAALYKSKTSGRNKVTHYREGFEARPVTA